ncbi:XRE family transcriptional regulator [Sinorhizobium meliloti]|uniref:helix-turn-helix domain-containing protein n=1 Tax=Rhizobium meliloti TaxID=382 RepID=UPI000FDA2165|nr:helix-turn-helix transcriptional regulator [Sinorhizobium meliloti]RVK81419.1 XRE family transcriptional regulator [Sinorhizobium meliloti]RVQ78041.1 XRE family transcriptional regulator [Sinorhizobium meliloti]
MARPETEPKTPLGARLRDCRKQLGDPDRDEFARSLGVSKSALASYERGESEPTASVLRVYSEKYGIDLAWLVTGAGEMFAPAKTPMPAPQLELVVVDKLAKIVALEFKHAGQRLPQEKIGVEAARLYNELSVLVSDMSNEEEVDAFLPQVRYALKKRLSEAASEPGSGKRSA